MAIPYNGPMPTNPFGPQPQIPDWLRQSQPLNAMPSTSPTLNIPNNVVKKGGMFGSGYGFGQALSDGLNGYLAGMGNPVGQQNIQAIHQQRMLEQQQALEAQQYAQHRADDNADWMSHYNYELNNPKPSAPGEFEQQLMASGVQPGTPEWAQAMKTRVNNLLDPAVMTPQGLMLRSQVTGALTPQPAPPGVTFTPLDNGGPTPPASGNFPGPY